MSGFVKNVLDQVFRLQNELELLDFKVVLLNDLSTIFYGLPRTINEIRVLVSPGDTKLLTEALVNTLHLYMFKDRIKEALDRQGSVAVNPVTIPLTYIVVAGNKYLSKILSSSKKIRVFGYTFSIPLLEAYISYLVKLNQYPYVVDGITLLLLWGSKISKEKISEYGLEANTICDIINSLVNRVNVFYELNRIVKKTYSIFCE